jgi:uroporphyrinogen-III synthase
VNQKAKKILFTRPIPEDIISYGKDLNLDIQAEEFIHIQHRELTPETQKLLMNDDYPNWVFTSQNAVKILHHWLPKLGGLQYRNCFAVGRNTAQRIAELGYMATVPQEQNAEGLVQHLAKIQPQGGFLYFCGNIRRNTLVEYFKTENLPYHEVLVYNTSLVQPKIDIKNYDALCFCSPSAVKSYATKYNFPANLPCFAIGETTALALVNYTDHLLVSETPNLKSMIDACQQYFNS